MTARHFIIATAGHVDHGKSALVKALTGTDPDRLPEEKARQITIELGFAELNLSGPKGEEIHAGMVDVPGHEDFVRNMIAGVGSIDLALFVVAADDGWMPQTEEHLQILSYLGIQRAVIALTKCDLGGIDEAAKMIRAQLRGTPFADTPIIPTSVRTGVGIDDLKRAIASELATTHPQRDIGKPRLFVDRAFILRGIGTVVTGTLTGGQLHRGQSVTVQPPKLNARIRSVQSHGTEIEYAQPGMRTALSLPDVSIDEIKRGDVITDTELDPSDAVIATIEQSSRLPAERAAAHPLKNGASVYLHHGTSRVAAKVTLLQANSLTPGEKTLARLRLASPMLAFLGDRFVIRDASEQDTLAGGVVLDPEGINRRTATELKLLSLRAAAPENVEDCVRSEVGLHQFVPTTMLLNKSRFAASEIAEALSRLDCRGEIVLSKGIAADRKAWRKLRDKAVDLIDQTHQRNSDRSGLDLNELRSCLRVADETVLEALIAELCAGDFVRTGSTIARRAHRPSLPSNLQPIAAKIQEALSQKPFDPPPRREIARDRGAQDVLRFLIETGDMIEVGADVVLLRENFERAKSQVIEFIRKNGPATVSQLRQVLESSRRIMVPLLEQLDREGFTRRVGDKRGLR